MKMLYQVLSPHPHFLFHGQLSQPHCYLAPPEAMTAFNQEQWLTEHMLWGLEGRGVPPKKPIHRVSGRKMHILLHDQPAAEGFTPTQKGHGCLNLHLAPGVQSNCTSRSCSAPSGIGHPEDPTLPNGKACKSPRNVHCFCTAHFYCSHGKVAEK